jgi:RND family efflux transporter MFP subunit
VEVITLKRHPVQPTALVSADLMPLRQVVVSAESAGKIRSLHVEVGDSVNKNQVLARVDATKAGHSLSLIGAQRDQARARLDKARRDLARAEELSKRGVMADSQLDAARNAVKLAEADVRAVSARHKLTANQLADSRALAPFAAIVASRHVEQGDFVMPGKPVVTLVDLSRVKVKAGLKMADAMKVSKGDRCQVRVDLAGSTQPLTGVVKVVGATADPRSRQVTVEVEIDNPEAKLKPGMIADVSFFLGPAAPTLLVPCDAVVEQFEIPYAYVVSAKERRAQRRKLRVGKRYGLHRAVLAGLKEGETLVVVGQESLSDGKPVNVVKRQPNPPPPVSHSGGSPDRP